MGHRRLAVRNRRARGRAARGGGHGHGAAGAAGPDRRARREPSRSTGPGRWPTRSPCSSRTAKGRTTDVHLLAWNDFHGNLEAGAGLNIYGQFAGGAAWLAKAVEDKQALYGDKEISVIAGDNIGASPLVDGLFFGEPSTIVTNLMHADFASVGNHEFDKGSAELLRIQNGGCGAGQVHGGSRTRSPTARRPTRTPVPTSSTCRPTSSATTTGRRSSRPTAPSRSRATAARSSRSASSERSSRPRPPSSRRPASPGSPSRTRPTPPTGSSSSSARRASTRACS